MSEWKMTERELGEVVFAAYKRGAKWAEENGFNEGYLSKAAADYTDGTLHELALQPSLTKTAPSKP